MMDYSFFENTYLNHGILIVVVFIFAYFSSRIIRSSIKRYLIKSTRKLKVDSTNYHFIANGSSAFIYLIALIIIFYTIPELKQFGVTLFAGAGILTVIIGFASQQAFSNIVGGIFIVIFKPFRVRDIVEIGGHIGKVEDITLRHTIINSFENKRIIFPNSVISAEVISNWSIEENKVCVFVPIGISYESDIDLARKIIQEEAEKHSYLIDNRTAEEKKNNVAKVVVRLINYGESSIDLRAYVWATDPEKGFALKYDLLEAVKKRFDVEGISIPYPHRVIINKNENS